MGKKIVISAVIVLFSALPPSYVFSFEQKQPFQFSQDRRIQQIRPKKPVKIKLHRTQKGEYAWDLTGDNVDDIVQADRRLRKLLKLE